MGSLHSHDIDNSARRGRNTKPVIASYMVDRALEALRRMIARAGVRRDRVSGVNRFDVSSAAATDCYGESEFS